MSDPTDAFERAAEANASRVMSGAVPAPAGATPTAQCATHTAADRAPAVQRTLVVGRRGYSAEYATASAGLPADQQLAIVVSRA